ncbi:MAG: AMP-binding protein, partial [Bacteroidota bacterium]
MTEIRSNFQLRGGCFRILFVGSICMRVTRLFDFIRHQAETHPKPDALAAKENGSWRRYSTTEFLLMADRFSAGLVAMGFQPGDKIALITNNRP